jgi:hypothetical protein
MDDEGRVIVELEGEELPLAPDSLHPSTEEPRSQLGGWVAADGSPTGDLDGGKAAPEDVAFEAASDCFDLR